MYDDNDIRLAKWLDGSITAEELKQLQQEVDLNALQQVLDQQKGFEMAHRPVEEMWTVFEEWREKNQPDKERSFPFDKRGGLLLILVILAALIGYFVLFAGKTTIETLPKEERKQVFADNTSVRISPGSQLTYEEANWDQLRQLELKGQAYFEVEKGAPFIVKTASGKIEVLGTSFDIWAMGDQLRVQCFEGRVRVSDSRGRKTVILQLQQQVVVNNSEMGAVENIAAAQPDWLLQQRVYQQVPLKWVLKDIERFYGLTIEAKAVSAESAFSGIIPLNNQNNALNYLCETMNWTYAIENSHITLSPK